MNNSTKPSTLIVNHNNSTKPSILIVNHNNSNKPSTLISLKFLIEGTRASVDFSLIAAISQLIGKKKSLKTSLSLEAR